MKRRMLGHCGAEGQGGSVQGRGRPVHRGMEEWGGLACCRALWGLGQLEHGIGVRDWLVMRWDGWCVLWVREDF